MKKFKNPEETAQKRREIVAKALKRFPEGLSKEGVLSIYKNDVGIEDEVKCLEHLESDRNRSTLFHLDRKTNLYFHTETLNKQFQKEILIVLLSDCIIYAPTIISTPITSKDDESLALINNIKAKKTRDIFLPSKSIYMIMICPNSPTPNANHYILSRLKLELPNVFGEGNLWKDCTYFDIIQCPNHIQLLTTDQNMSLQIYKNMLKLFPK